MLQNGGAYYAQNDGLAQNEDTASGATERVTDGEYADSAPDLHGSYQAPVANSHQAMQAGNNYASTEQDSFEEEHEDTTSEGTR